MAITFSASNGSFLAVTAAEPIRAFRDTPVKVLLTPASAERTLACAACPLANAERILASAACTPASAEHALASAACTLTSAERTRASEACTLASVHRTLPSVQASHVSVRRSGLALYILADRLPSLSVQWALHPEARLVQDASVFHRCRRVPGSHRGLDRGVSACSRMLPGDRFWGMSPLVEISGPRRNRDRSETPPLKTGFHHLFLVRSQRVP